MDLNMRLATLFCGLLGDLAWPRTTFRQAATLCRRLRERKKYLREGVLFSGGVIIPLNTHKAPGPCRRSKNKPLRLALPASNDSLPIARANAAMWCAAPTPRARASLATICETVPNTRHGKRYHPLSKMPATPAAWRYWPQWAAVRGRYYFLACE